MNKTPRQIAVVEIGSTSLRVVIADIDEKQQWRVLDRAGKHIGLGRDVFANGEITWEALRECILALMNFKELMKGWSIDYADIHVIATSALRAARNRDIFIDRVRQETGFLVKLVDGIEENRLMYLGARFALKQDLPQFLQGDSMIIEIGGGSTEIMLLNQGKIVSAHSLRLGTLLVEQAVYAYTSIDAQERYLRDNVRVNSEFLNGEMELAHIRTFVIVGADAWYLASHRGRTLNENSKILTRDDFLQFVDTIRSYTLDECARKFQLPYSEALRFITRNLVYQLFLERTSADQVALPYISIREGFLIDLTMEVEPELQDEFFSQIIASAINLGKKYHFDEAHNRHVAFLSLTLFDALVREHGMNRRERTLLEVAATLHDVGMFIHASEHQKHGQYIVANSEIFGIYGEERSVIANVIRYHRGEPPAETDIDYIALQREERILLMKMASLLRVADSLDRSHTQHIKDVQVEKRGESIILHTNGNVDTSSELKGLDEKADMFRNVFGYKVILTQGNG